MSIQSVVQEAATNIDNILAKPHEIGDWVAVNINDLNLVMEALAATWPPKETIENLTAKKRPWRAVIRAVDPYWSVQNLETGDDWPDYKWCINEKEARIVADFANWLEARYNSIKCL